MKQTLVSLCVLAALASPALSQANLIVNGSFESFGGTGFNSNIGAGLTGWAISGGGIDIVDQSYWDSADGATSLSLGWTSPAMITQTVATSAGQQYDLSFFMAAEIYGGSALRSMDVLWNGVTVAQPTFAYTGQGPTDMGWTQHSVMVTGTGSDVLQFSSTTYVQPNYGPALDHVQLTPVPEPATVSALVLGVAAMLRRRRS